MLEVLHGRLRKWFSCGCRRQPFPFQRRSPRWVGRGPTNDIGLDHKVVSTANHHKMFDIVAADEDDAALDPLTRQNAFLFDRGAFALSQF
jgi:hypothetical protein